MKPGADTPPHYHECGEAVVLLSGRGRTISEVTEQADGARETVTFEAGEVHQLVNSGKEPIRLLAVLNEATPARAFTPDGEELELPW